MKISDLDLNIEEIRSVAEQGDSNIQAGLGLYYYEKGNDDEAVKWFKKAAKQGQPLAQFHLGKYLLGGIVCKEDLKEAVKWFKKAAKQDFPNAQFSLGVCLYNGEGVTQNLKEAVKWFKKAAKQDFPMAQYNLGYCLLGGIGVKENRTAALEWLHKAAGQGNDRAQKLLDCITEGHEPVLEVKFELPYDE